MIQSLWELYNSLKSKNMFSLEDAFLFLFHLEDILSEPIDIL